MLRELVIQLKGKGSTEDNTEEDLIPPEKTTGQSVRRWERFEDFATLACRDWKRSENSISNQCLDNAEGLLTPIML